MSKKQIISLFLCCLVAWPLGNGLLPLLPVYAMQLGADPAASAYYLSFSYLALAVGTLTAGWLSDRFQRRKIPIILSGLASIPIAWLIGKAGNIWSLSLLTAMLWACGGLGLTLLGILAGLSAGKQERGKIFGILSLTGGLGALLGGLATGYLADRWDYSVMFSAMAGFFILMPLTGLFLTEIKVEQLPGDAGLTRKKVNLGRNYHLLFSASLIASVTSFIIRLGISLLMNEQDFGALAISSTTSVGGAVAMPIPFLMGWLSDRTGRKIYLYLGYLAGIASLLILAKSTSLWNFYCVAILQALLLGINGTIGNALVTDLVPQGSLGRGLALFGATAWIGGILGFGGAGYVLQNLGIIPTFIIGASLPLIAMVLLLPIRPGMQDQGC
jgi:MFS family permease